MKNKEKICPACNGEGTWYTECCDGSQGCSCHGQPVFMGQCKVCHGVGEVVEEQYNIEANRNSIRGMSYIGFSPTRRW